MTHDGFTYSDGFFGTERQVARDLVVENVILQGYITRGTLPTVIRAMQQMTSHSAGVGFEATRLL